MYKQNNVVIPFEFDEIDGYFYEGLTRACRDGKWGFINTQDEAIVPFRYTKKPTNFKNGYFTAYRISDNSYCFIDKQGTVHLTAEYIDGPFSDGRSIIKTNEGQRQYKLIDSTLNEQIDFGRANLKQESYQGAETRVEKYNEFMILRPSGWTADYTMDYNRNIIFRARTINSFYNNLALTEFINPENTQEILFGYVNTKGEVVILFKANEF